MILFKFIVGNWGRWIRRLIGGVWINGSGMWLPIEAFRHDVPDHKLEGHIQYWKHSDTGCKVEDYR